MNLIKFGFLVFFLIPLTLLAQNTKNVPSNDKEYPAYLQRARDSAYSLKKRNDSLSDKINSIQSGRREKPEKLDLDISEVKASFVFLAIGLLIFSLILIMAILYFLYKLEKGFGSYAFQTIGLIIVVNAALFLIVTGYDKDQITPIIGLLGTIVGFIFGSNLSNGSKARTGQIESKIHDDKS